MHVQATFGSFHLPVRALSFLFFFFAPPPCKTRPVLARICPPSLFTFSTSAESRVERTWIWIPGVVCSVRRTWYGIQYSLDAVQQSSSQVLRAPYHSVLQGTPRRPMASKALDSLLLVGRVVESTLYGVHTEHGVLGDGHLPHRSQTIAHPPPSPLLLLPMNKFFRGRIDSPDMVKAQISRTVVFCSGCASSARAQQQRHSVLLPYRILLRS